MVDSLPRIFNGLLSCAHFHRECEEGNVDMTELEAWLRKLQPDSQEIKDLVKQATLYNHFPKELRHKMSTNNAEAMATSAAQARQTQPQATRASPAQPEPTTRPKK